jgi:hypothetical protein
MVKGLTLKGIRFEIEGSLLQKKSFFNLQIQALDLPAIAKVSVTVLTLVLNIGISKAE